ncbi:hypothetical protein FHW69_001031 [Luteibacter sp. Sphag1AF]|uniref:hypothetical protein n=1 Tax=Luteibacter sp. Sphag1AF TaxID=2587031 RepID=UPI00162314C7|nr:hypothetical protein [Luteibacter sp. Sphag1AF]MBB3226441.1 hypothetical protein [Luteibacter sp. Sphag1AF]
MDTVNDSNFDATLNSNHIVLVVFGDQYNNFCTRLVSGIDSSANQYPNLAFRFCDMDEAIASDYYTTVYSNDAAIVIFKDGADVDDIDVDATAADSLYDVADLCAKWNSSS